MAELLTPEIMSWIGKTDPPLTEEISRRDIRRYAVATDQRLEKYLNGDEAPPMFHSTFFREIKRLEHLEADGHVADTLLPPLPLKRVMAGGHETTFHRPIRPGDQLTATRRLSELTEKQGRTGPLIFVIVETEITAADGETILTERYTRILR